jgi:Tfp pilus assembly protein PilF
MTWFVRRARLGLVVVLLGAATFSRAQTASPQPGPDLAGAYGQAMQQFQAGDYLKAAAGLETVISRAEFTPQLEPLYYTIGSAYFMPAITTRR